MTWRTITGKELVPPGSLQLETLLKGVFDNHRLLDLIRNFIVFEDDGEKVVKKLAGYHQFHAVNKAVETTLRAAGVSSESSRRRREETRTSKSEISQSLVTSSPTSENIGDRRAGVIWHTQGSGKSLSMVFYAGKIVQHPAMENPTVVVLTDRNDLDDQLFDTFSFCKELLRQTPVQAKDRDDLRSLLKRGALGGALRRDGTCAFALGHSLGLGPWLSVILPVHFRLCVLSGFPV